MLLEGFHLRDAAVCFSGAYNFTGQFSFRVMLPKGEGNAKIMKACILNI